jgi:hypothetical protein
MISHYQLVLSWVALFFIAIPLAFGQSIDDPFPMPLCYGYVIEEASINTIQQYISNGNLTSVQLTKCLLQRIAQLNLYLGYSLNSHTNEVLLLKPILMLWTSPRPLTWNMHKARYTALFMGFPS